MNNRQEKPLTVFKSKASTLQLLLTLLQKSYVEDLYVLTQGEWEKDKMAGVKAVRDKFQGKTIIIRSSALNEDTADCSNAGYFESVLNVNSADIGAVHDAIQAVVDSYIRKESGHADNPILVQAQTMDVVSSGTVLTRDYNGAPYYVVNYSEEDTTSVTGGRHSKSVKILQSDEVKPPLEFAPLIDAVKEIEQLAHSDMPLDIEFGICANGNVVTFQVRPLVAAQVATYPTAMITERVNSLRDQFVSLAESKPHLAGKTTLFGDMPDWNPAEIIGNSPHALAVSLYDEIITGDIWHQARTSQGYTDVNPAKLVVQFANKPYVDVRNSFNSLIPAAIPAALKRKLLTFYLEKLKANPQFQDKVEFDILHTCYDLSFDRRSAELLEAGFTQKDVKILRKALLELTNNLLATPMVAKDIASNVALEKYRSSLPKLKKNASLKDGLERVLLLLAACKENGTVQFSRLARLSFVGKSLLRSMVEEGVIDEAMLDTFLSSISTVVYDFARDTDLLNSGQLSVEAFLKEYGHLRPGTYDITISRYDKAEDYFGVTDGGVKKTLKPKPDFVLTPEQNMKISRTLHEKGFTLNAQELFTFVRTALETREYSKFLFTKSLSDVIETIAFTGEAIGFSREDLSHLDVATLKESQLLEAGQIRKYWEGKIKQRKAEYELNSYIILPPVIFSAKDLDVVSYYDSHPSFITNKKTGGKLIFLSGETQEDIAGKIVVIESADPGYDWIFTKGPRALITKYGGPASHMAIRCAESGLPAVIGVGEVLYELLAHASSIVLDCENEHIKPHGGVN